MALIWTAPAAPRGSLTGEARITPEGTLKIAAVGLRRNCQCAVQRFPEAWRDPPEASPRIVAMKRDFRRADVCDLKAINDVIEAAIGDWSVTDRVKRLALPVYRYDSHDLTHLQIDLLFQGGLLAGVVAWEAAGPEDTIGRDREALLHGIYVHPERQRTGIGRGMLESARRSAAAAGFSGFIVKASKDARGFFETMGLDRVAGNASDYPYLYWLDFKTVDRAELSRIIEMAWEDRTPFEAIEQQFGASQSDVIKLMRRELRAGSFRLWRRRVKGRRTKHRALRDPKVMRAHAPGQYKR